MAKPAPPALQRRCNLVAAVAEPAHEQERDAELWSNGRVRIDEAVNVLLALDDAHVEEIAVRLDTVAAEDAPFDLGLLRESDLFGEQADRRVYHLAASVQ